VPYAFEKRVMAHVARRGPPDAWAAAGTFLWRAVGACFGVMLLVGAGSFAVPGPGEELADQLDAILVADLDPGVELP
jgi:hypothetical protein